MRAPRSSTWNISRSTRNIGPKQSELSCDIFRKFCMWKSSGGGGGYLSSPVNANFCHSLFSLRERREIFGNHAHNFLEDFFGTTSAHRRSFCGCAVRGLAPPAKDSSLDVQPGGGSRGCTACKWPLQQAPFAARGFY